MRPISTTYRGGFKNRYGNHADIVVSYGPTGKVARIDIEDVFSINDPAALTKTIKMLQDLQTTVEWEPPKPKKARAKKGTKTKASKAPGIVHSGFSATESLGLIPEDDL